jgi:hypothetical protein
VGCLVEAKIGECGPHIMLGIPVKAMTVSMSITVLSGRINFNEACIWYLGRPIINFLVLTKEGFLWELRTNGSSYNSIYASCYYIM